MGAMLPSSIPSADPLRDTGKKSHAYSFAPAPEYCLLQLTAAAATDMASKMSALQGEAHFFEESMNPMKVKEYLGRPKVRCAQQQKNFPVSVRTHRAAEPALA